jgi:hypothetical protein
MCSFTPPIQLLYKPEFINQVDEKEINSQKRCYGEFINQVDEKEINSP